MHTTTRSPLSRNRGFTLIEMMIAMMMMAVGILAGAQLVPFSMRLNNANREGFTPLVLAQRGKKQIIQQPLAYPPFTDSGGNGCAPRNSAPPNHILRSPVRPL